MAPTKSFKVFLGRLLDKPNNGTKLIIKDKKKRIQGMARSVSINFNEEYIKIAFTDHSHLLVIPSEKKLYHTEKPLGKAVEISDDRDG